MTGAELKALREQRGWAQQDLADVLNGALGRSYGSSTISQWETGKRNTPAAVVAFLEELVVAEFVDGLGPEQTPPPPSSVDDPPGAPLGVGETPPGQPALGLPGGFYSRICAELFEMLGTLIAVTGTAVRNDRLVIDGQIIAADKEALGRAYGKLAETNETFRRMLVGATTSGAWLEVSMVTVGTATKIWHNHMEGRLVAAVPAAGAEPSLVDGVAA